MTASNDSPNKEMIINEKSPTGADFSDKQMVQGATLTAIFLTVFGLFSSIGGSLKGNIVSWQDYILLGTPIIVFILGLISIVLLRRGNILSGVRLVFIANFLLPIVASLLQTGLGGAVFIYALISSVLLIWRTMPKTSRTWTISLTALTLAFIFLIERFNPSIRVLASAELSIFFYSASAILAAIFLVQAVRQSWGVISGSMQLKITLWAGLVFMGVSTTLIVYSAVTARQTAIETAQSEALAFAASQAKSVRADVEIPLDTARALAQALTAIKDPASNLSLSRDQVNAMLRQVLIENPTFLGTDTLWEPNAFDGLDAAYRGKEAHDETGRFIPYWVRGDDGSISVTALVDYETPGLGDWYLIPRQTKKEVVLAPLIYPIEGVNTVMASSMVPIVFEGKFYGITGVDAPIAFVQDIVDKVDLYNGKAEAALFTSSGTLIGVRNKPELVNQPATEIYPDFSALQARIEAGEAFISFSPDGQYLRAFAPVDLGRTGTRWSFGLTIPFSEITSPATASALRQGAIGFVLILLALALLWFLSGQIVRPVRALTAAATAISQGNLNIKAEVQATDETGLLANAFNSMTSQLRDLINSLEGRVAARTKDLATVAEVGTATATILETDRLLQEVVDLTKERFGLYHSHIYLLDESGENLVLASGAGEPGRQMMAKGLSIPLDREQSLVARAARERKGVIVNDVTQASDFLPNPLLPNTRSELAVPMIIGGKVIGVFDVQSDQVGRFTDSDINIQTTLAAQVATSIQNVRSFEQAKAQADLESLVNAIGQKIQRTTSVDDTLQTAIREVGLALGATRVSANIQASRQPALSKENLE